MNKKRTDLEEMARKLAEKPYSIEIMKDETTTGEPIFLLLHPELEGCMAQGLTIEEGLENLKEATEEYVLSLLEDGLDVPEPSITASVTTGASVNYQDDNYSSTETVQPHTRHKLSEVTLVS